MDHYHQRQTTLLALSLQYVSGKAPQQIQPSSPETLYQTMAQICLHTSCTPDTSGGQYIASSGPGHTRHVLISKYVHTSRINMFLETSKSLAPKVPITPLDLIYVRWVNVGVLWHVVWISALSFHYICNYVLHTD